MQHQQMPDTRELWTGRELADSNLPLRVSYGQLGVAPHRTYPIEHEADVGADDRDVGHEASDGAEEVAKQHDDAVELDEKADERPPKQDQEYSGRERRRALEFLSPREEDQRLLRADDQGQAEDEQDLLGPSQIRADSRRGEARNVRYPWLACAIAVSLVCACTTRGTHMARSKNMRTPPIRKKPPVTELVSKTASR